jgi:hypothetical protein
MMLPATKRKRTKFRGICRFAKLAGVDRVHAYRVLMGQRESHRLLTLWEQFKKENKIK